MSLPFYILLQTLPSGVKVSLVLDQPVKQDREQKCWIGQLVSSSGMGHDLRASKVYLSASASLKLV
jgi:hypothetical protein